VSLRPLSDVRLFAPGAERRVDIEVTAARDGAAGTLDLKAPTGWTVTPASQPFRLSSAGDWPGACTRCTTLSVASLRLSRRVRVQRLQLWRRVGPVRGGELELRELRRGRRRRLPDEGERVEDVLPDEASSGLARLDVGVTS